MKIIDRYITRLFLTPLMYCLVAFIMTFILLDLFDNMGKFIKADTPLPDILYYYALFIPSALIYIVPTSLLLAVLYSLSQLTKNNELTAMRASGISLYRLMGPFAAAGIIASLLLSLINETVAPQASYRSSQFVELQKKDDEAVHTVQYLAHKNEKDHRIWLIQQFDKNTYEMKNIEVVQQVLDDRGTPRDQYKIIAEEGRWSDGRWNFSGPIVKYFYDERGDQRKSKVFEEKQLEMKEYSEQPSDFLNEIKDPKYLSSREILTFIKARKLSDAAIARYMVNFHHRLAAPWTCLIVTLIGIPFGSQTGRKGAFRGFVLIMALFFGYYFFMNACAAMGKMHMSFQLGERIVYPFPPIVAGWLPTVLFLAISLFMVRRMR